MCRNLYSGADVICIIHYRLQSQLIKEMKILGGEEGLKFSEEGIEMRLDIYCFPVIICQNMITPTEQP